MKYCYSLGQCEEDYCDCDNIVKMESEEQKRADLKMGIMFGILLVGLFLAIIW